jgi:hypothetical protein
MRTDPVPIDGSRIAPVARNPTESSNSRTIRDRDAGPDADTRRRYPPLSLSTPRQGAKGRPLIGGGDGLHRWGSARKVRRPGQGCRRGEAAGGTDRCRQAFGRRDGVRLLGEIVIPPFQFPLNEDGFQDFSIALARAEAQRDATWMRVGLESAGHYHRPLQSPPFSLAQRIPMARDQEGDYANGTAGGSSRALAAETRVRTSVAIKT